MYFILLGLILIVLYIYGRRNHDHWKKKGIKYEEPLLFFGSTLKNITEGVCFSQRFENMYKKYSSEKYVGFFEGNKPGLLIRDPDIIQQIMVTDFRNYHYRGTNPLKEANEPLMNNLFNVEGDNWKLTRQKVTPAFSGAKLKAMFPLVVQQAEKLLDTTKEITKTNPELDARELMARFTTDFIGVCGFGVDLNSLNDESSEFRRLGKLIFTVTKRDMIVSILKRLAPNMFKKIHFASPELEKTCIGLIKHLLVQRNYKPSGRHDFIDLLLEIKENGKIIGESLEKGKPDSSKDTVELEVNDEFIVAQVFVFFAAGFETSSSSTSSLLHLLAYHPDEQERCQREIDEVLARYNGKLCYEAIKDMKYLEMAFKEAIRIYTTVGWISRRCASKHVIRETGLVIDEGTDIIISTQGLHMDEKYFKDPEEFRPERFDPDNISNIKNVYMPFGVGPRACVGERLGLMQSLAGVAAILSKFSVAPSKNTVRNPVIDPSSNIVTSVKGGLPLLFTYRDKMQL